MKFRFVHALILLGIACLMPNRVQAQDPQYTQFYSNMVMLNPAFTGSGIGYRVAMNYRGQWVGVPGYYKQYAMTADMPLYIGNTVQGIGLHVASDVAGEGNLARTDIQLSYGYRLDLNRERTQTLCFGLSGGIQQSSIQFYKLRFPDQIDPREGFIYQTQEPSAWRPNRIIPDFNAGIAYFNQYAFVSATAHHLAEPLQRFGTGQLGQIQGQTIDAKLPRRYTVSGGVRIPLGDFRDRDKFSLTPVISARMQRQFFQLDAGMYLNVEPMVFGVWYRHQDAVAGLIGFKKDNFRIGYSYDYTISTLTQRASGGSHEISLVMEIAKYRNKRFKHNDLPCPRF